MAAAIHVVLQTSVENLGTGGDVVKVRAGYARNYLLPRGLAAPATAGNLARVEELKRLAAESVEKELTSARDLAKKLEGTSVKLERAVGEENRMYGSVTAKDIAEAYAERGFELDRRKIQLSEPIRQLGLTEVPVKLHASVVVSLRVEVVKKT